MALNGLALRWVGEVKILMVNSKKTVQSLTVIATLPD
jgi:hypothetical protein